MHTSSIKLCRNPPPSTRLSPLPVCLCLCLSLSVCFYVSCAAGLDSLFFSFLVVFLRRSVMFDVLSCHWKLHSVVGAALVLSTFHSSLDTIIHPTINVPPALAVAAFHLLPRQQLT